MLIDTHAHLYLQEFDTDRDSVVQRALDSGVTHVLMPNIDNSTISAMNQLAGRWKGVCYPMMGLHPTSVKGDFKWQIEIVEQELASGRYIAIGETGMDLYWDTTHTGQQAICFARHIELALQYNLPIVIHSRQAFPQILEVLEDFRNRNLRGVFHAFSGDVAVAEEITRKGLMIGVGGVVTYKKTQLPDVIRAIGLQHVVLETDAPYLAPVPHRGRRNESAYLTLTAGAIAAILSVSLDEVTEITSANACKLFNLQVKAEE